MNDETIAYQGTISRELFFHAQRLHGRKYLSPFLMMISGFTAALYLAFWFSGEEAFQRGAISVAAIGLIGTPFLLVARRYLWGRIYARTPYFQEPLRGLISRASFRAESSTGASDVP